MMKLVNFVIPNNERMIFLLEVKVSEKKIPFTFHPKNAYIVCVNTVTYLITVPIIEEFRGFGGNFHNCHGSYLSRIYVP